MLGMEQSLRNCERPNLVPASHAAIAMGWKSVSVAHGRIAGGHDMNGPNLLLQTFLVRVRFSELKTAAGRK